MGKGSLKKGITIMEKRSFKEVLARLAEDFSNAEIKNQCLVEIAAMQEMLAFNEILIYWALTTADSNQELLAKTAMTNLLAKVVANPMVDEKPIEVETYRRIMGRKIKQKFNKDVEVLLLKVYQEVPLPLCSKVLDKFHTIPK